MFWEKHFIKHMIFEKFQAPLTTKSSDFSNLKYYTGTTLKI